MTAPDTRPAGDRGAGAVTVLLTVFATLVLLAAAAALGTAAVAAARASAAADLAALAAADATRGLVAADACTLAGQVAGRHGGQLTECSPAAGDSVLVRTRYASPLPWPAEGVSGAGPPPALSTG
jgi:secretion/DNA translocation related TadE-like protein